MTHAAFQTSEQGDFYSNGAPKVAVIYHFFPHYREAVLRSLAKSDRYEYVFYGAHSEFSGIKPFCGNDDVTVHPIGMSSHGRRFRLSGYDQVLSDPDVRAIILIGNPNILDTWIIAASARLRGKRVLYWTHGWLRPEHYIKAKIRNIYFGLANFVLVYGERAAKLAAASGFPQCKVRPIYNSLDWDTAEKVYQALSAKSADATRARLGIDPGRALLICTARLTPLCRFDLLLEAMDIARRRHGLEASLLLVGDGPERGPLEQRSKELGLDVHFTGAIYDESRIGELLYSADLTVSPGKVGLTAMHSLTYGTPVLTHSDLDNQMPEVEAVVDGETGCYFERNDADDLARALLGWMSNERSREQTRALCRATIARSWNPEVQRRLIEQSLDDTLASEKAT